MRGVKLLATTGVACLLAACGGGGGGVGSTPLPPAAPTPPTTTSFADPLTSRTFGASGVASDVSFDLTSRTTISGAAAPGTVSVSYDATASSYTVTAGGRSQSFLPADIQGASDGPDVVYRKTDGANRDFLTLVRIPFTGFAATQYVRLGFWQRNVVAGARQDTLFSAFAYGFDTPAAAVPRSGGAAFDVDVFGLVATPGVEPRTFVGRGDFNVDFAAGVFGTETSVEETGLISGASIVGGGVELVAGGRLSSDGGLSGNMVYGGRDGFLAGTLSGRLYGPSGQELGGSFAGSRSGATVTGAFTGQRRSTPLAANLTLTNIVTSELYATLGANLSTTNGATGFTANALTTNGQLTDQLGGNLSFTPGISLLPAGPFPATAMVASSDANFTSYQKDFDGRAVRLDMYKPGSGNRELQLSYVSFGRWVGTIGSNTERTFFAYGLHTPPRQLTARTGSARYNGVVYGAAASRADARQLEVSGSSRFDVNFSNQNYTGNLSLRGTPVGGAGNVDLGAYDFMGQLAAVGTDFAAPLIRAGIGVGEITSRFYGPDGEEIGSRFVVNVPDGAAGAVTSIVGVTVAKRQ